MNWRSLLLGVRKNGKHTGDMGRKETQLSTGEIQAIRKRLKAKVDEPLVPEEVRQQSHDEIEEGTARVKSTASKVRDSLDRLRAAVSDNVETEETLPEGNRA